MLVRFWQIHTKQEGPFFYADTPTPLKKFPKSFIGIITFFGVTTFQDLSGERKPTPSATATTTTTTTTESAEQVKARYIHDADDACGNVLSRLDELRRLYEADDFTGQLAKNLELREQLLDEWKNVSRSSHDSLDFELAKNMGGLLPGDMALVSHDFSD